MIPVEDKFYELFLNGFYDQITENIQKEAQVGKALKQLLGMGKKVPKKPKPMLVTRVDDPIPEFGRAMSGKKTILSRRISKKPAPGKKMTDLEERIRFQMKLP